MICCLFLSPFYKNFDEEGSTEYPFRDCVGFIRFQFFRKPSETVRIKEKVIDRRLPVPVHCIGKYLSISTDPRHMAPIRSMESLNHLLCSIHPLNDDGVRDKTFQIRNRPPLFYDLLACGSNRNDQNSKA